MYGLTTDVGRQIEANLSSMLGAREQALIRAYLMAENGSRDPVIVLTDRTVFANTAGVPHLDSTTHAVLWSHLSELAPTDSSNPIRVPLSGEWREALVEAVEGNAGQQPAWCIRLLPDRPRRRETGDHDAGDHDPETSSRRRVASSSPSEPGSAETVGRSHLVAVLDERRTLALEGAPGTGKLHQALRLLDEADPLVLDVSGFRRTDGVEWSGPALDALDSGRPVVLRHIEDLHIHDVNRVRALAAAAAGGHPVAGLVMTWDSTDAPDHVRRLVCRTAPTVRLPALADTPQRIAGLVSLLLTELAPFDRRPRLSSDALQCLMRWTWPGNIDELRGVLRDLRERLPGHTVRQADLPARLQQASPRRSTSLMESAERQAIVSALQQSAGNRSLAAELLGIGRTTLYRKMQQLRIDS